MTLAARPLRWLRSLVVRSATGAARFPVAVLAILAFAALSQVSVAQGEVRFERLLAALPGAGVLSVAVALFLEARGWAPASRMILSAVAASGVGAAIGWAEPFAVHAPMLLAATLLAVPLAPFAGRGSARDFWVFALWTSLGVALAFVTVLLVCVGIQAILEMIRYLFRIGLLRDLDKHLFTAAVTLVGPLFALGRVPVLDDPHAAFSTDDRLVRAVRPLFDWVQAPLVLVAALVLHVYAARIVLTGEVPRNEIGWIVATYSVLLMQLRVALDPFRDGATLAARVVMRHWLSLLAVPLALLAFALWQRVASEGWTLDRYALGLWLAALVLMVCVQALPKPRGDIRALLAIPTILLALGTFGPWGVASTVGRSQTDRIEAEVGPALAGADAAASELTGAQAQRLRTRLWALDSVGELPRVRPLLSAERASGIGWDGPGLRVEDVMATLRVAPDRTIAAGRRFEAGFGEPIDVAGFDTVVPALDASRPGRAGSTPVALALGEGGTVAELRWNAVRDEIDLAPLLAELRFVQSDQAGTRTGATQAGVARREFTTRDGRRIAVRPDRVVLGPSGAIESATLTLLLRSEEWR